MDIWQEHPSLFHYTRTQGLKGILETRTLHATHYGFLNDSTEIVTLRPKLAELAVAGVRRAYASLARDPAKCARMEERGGIDALVAKDVQVIVDALYDVTLGTMLPFRHFEPYITSFCGHLGTYEIENGLLSQWRGYGSDSGYAIVFDTKLLNDALVAECKSHFYSSGNLGTVVYDGDPKTFVREFDQLVKVIDTLSEQMLSEPRKDLRSLWAPLISSLSRYKHQGFKEEQEVRVVVSPMSQAFIDHMAEEDARFPAAHAGKTLKRRHTRPNLSSYIALFDGADRPLPITKIIVGPHVDKDMRRSRLQRYLELLGLEIEVVCSRTPLVG